MRRLPLLIFVVVFITLVSLTQFLAYQQYKILQARQQTELIHEAAAVKDRFRNILFSDLAAANTLAIIYKQYGVPDKFDSIAREIMQTSRYAKVLQITERGIVKEMYPDTQQKRYTGLNILNDPMRKAEAERAIEKKEIYFAGPRKLWDGGTGILGKVPIIINNEVKALAVVQTNLPDIIKALEPAGSVKNKFAYQLLKINRSDTASFLLSSTKPNHLSESVAVDIPEGDWLLRVSYGQGYHADKFPYESSGLGILFSLAAALLAYRKAQEPRKLNEIISDKTAQLVRSENYFRTLIETSSDAIVLLDIEGRVLYQTPSAEKILGYNLSEVREIDGLELIHPDDRADDNKIFEESIRVPGTVLHRRHRIKSKNGGYLHIDGTYRNLLHDEHIKAIVYSYKDVTEKVLSDQSVASYNHELTLLNKINDIILRVDDEMQLYREVCDCIVTVGGYPLAWMCHKPGAGAADQTLIPLVAIGATEYLDGARIVLNDPVLSNGPTAIALNTGKTVVNNDLTNTTYFSDWMKRADIFGIRSSVSLHLNLGDDKTGALIIYSERANSFDAHEVSTFERLAANLSIAIQNIQNRSVLAESENRFRRAFEDSAIGMALNSIEKDSMGRWLKVNRSLCQMLGYTEEELLLRTFMETTHPDDLARDLAARDRLLQGESDTYRLEKRYIHKDGSYVWINLNVSLIRDKDNQPVYLVAQVENISEKVESQTKFQNLVENFVVGVYILQNDKLAYINPRVMEETGYTEDEIIGMPFNKFIYDDDLKIVTDIIDARTKHDIQTVRYEARITHKNGSPLWYEILGGAITYQGAPALIGTMVNITERKAVYDELKKSEANLKSIFDTTNVSYLLLDVNYNIIALNQQMKDMYIAVAAAVLNEGDNLIGFIPPEKREKAKAIYDHVVQTNRALDYETTYFKDGAGTHFLANVKPINDGKKVIGVCISALDVTDRRNALEQLKNLNDNLQRQARELAVSNAELEQFAYVASHDLQEPLRMVTSFLTQLEKKYSGVLDEKAKQYIYFATDGAKRMRQLILDLLEYSRVGRTEDALEEVDFNTLVREVLIFFRRGIEERGATVLFNQLPVLKVCKPPMRQVFQNLIGNALKYHKGSAAPVVEILCIEGERSFEFIVRDNGIGINSDYFDQIFIIFKRLHNRDEYPGTGMGLAITKKIIEHFNGKIWVSSKEGNGSSFHFTIPKNISR